MAVGVGRQDFWNMPRHEVLEHCRWLSTAHPDEQDVPDRIIVHDNYMSDRSDATFMLKKR